MIPGHPGQPGGRLGTKEDAQDVLTLMQEASAEIKKLGAGRQVLGRGREGIQVAEVRDACPATRPACRMVARRYCGLWGRGT